jgi:uncharacterized protein (TIGR03067 family)
MKTMSHLKLCLLAGLLVAGVAGCSHKPAKPALDGRWTGFEVRQPNSKCTLAIDGGQMEYHGANSNDWIRGTFVINDKVQPAQMDITLMEPVGSPYTGKIALGVYELQGDELKVAAAEPGSNLRPGNVAGGPNIQAFVFKRE